MAVVAPHPWTPPIFVHGEIVFDRTRAGDAFICIAEIIAVEENGYRVHYMIVQSGLEVGTQCFYPSPAHRPAIIAPYSFNVGDIVLGKMRAEFNNSKLYEVQITWREEYDCSFRYHITYVGYVTSWDHYVEAHEVSRLLFRIHKLTLNFSFTDSNGMNHVLPLEVTTRLPLENHKQAVVKWVNTMLARRVTKNRVTFVVRGQTLDSEISSHDLKLYGDDQVSVIVA
ncbi:hypothetical protein PRIPAC_96382 [Pristionchus pacificus]|uniref:Uncharacterized protein n=1 Tax=Pristionchus pacificus TaxID=54126 RepID=A0A2A6BXX9_PRIPA|nr:hypothetical protein PRIPAC_96382 [Pristionchus pacificus]|eukprot:PDM70677.1 hypothetical protein PRIPAC_43882 [Pristionchus pacificus]